MSQRMCCRTEIFEVRRHTFQKVKCTLGHQFFSSRNYVHHKTKSMLTVNYARFWIMTKLGLLLLVLAPYLSLAEDCSAGEQSAVFTLFLDEDSETEQGWSMQCDQDTIWQVPTGILQETTGRRGNGHYIRDTACIAETATCDFTIEDSYGDGLYSPGNYVLKYGAETIAVYDHTPFEERSYCFGPDCLFQPQESAQACDATYFHLKLDAFPQDTSYTVECDNGGVIWTGSNFSVPFDIFEDDVCIEPNSCCRLTMHDTESDGLTGTSDGDYGSVYLEWANQRIFAYDGSNGYEFGSVMVDFGLGC
jgi:hypothetical protein